MSTALKKIDADALKLSVRSRARLTERLVRSLEEAADPLTERAWLEDIERLSAELKGGKAIGISLRRCLRKRVQRFGDSRLSSSGRAAKRRTNCSRKANNLGMTVALWLRRTDDSLPLIRCRNAN
jgi:rRNA-processing protein FCF1